MIYQIYIKSHCEAPDFEAEIEAKDDQELKEIVSSRYDIELHPYEYQSEEEIQQAMYDHETEDAREMLEDMQALQDDYLEAEATGN